MAEILHYWSESVGRNYLIFYCEKFAKGLIKMNYNRLRIKASQGASIVGRLYAQ